MKLLLRITPMVLIILGLFFIVGCEDDDDEDVDPLVGTWAFSNMEQSSVYTAANADLAAYGYNQGDTLGSGGLDWATFSAMGVNGTVALLEDGTFTLSGSFPIGSDTLGFAPTITPLTDDGTWAEDATAGTLLIDGDFYDLGGMMTLSEDESEIALIYASVDPDTVVLPVAVDLNEDGVLGNDFIPGVAINDASTTTLGFARQ